MVATTKASDPRLAAAFRDAAEKMVEMAAAQRAAVQSHTGLEAYSSKQHDADEPHDWWHTTGRDDITAPEVALAKRCHGAHIEQLSQDVTSVASHFQLIHYDVAYLDGSTYSLLLDGLVEKPMKLGLEELKARPSLTEPVMMACAGTGRMDQTNRFWLHVPWGPDSIGCSVWTGCSLADLLKEAGLKEGARQVVFTGADKGLEGNSVQYFQRSLSLDDAMLGNCLLAYEMNGRELPSAHGYPLRLLVPGWYGMASVKWLTRIEVTSGGWWGHQMAAYSYRRTDDYHNDNNYVPVKQMFVRALMAPPGYPDFFSRVRLVAPGRQLITGRAWAGPVDIDRVEFSSDGGKTWVPTALEEKNGPFGWAKWSVEWEAPASGNAILSCRAFDKAGRSQDLRDGGDELFNIGSFTITKPQEVFCKVDPKIATPGETIDVVPETRAARDGLWEADGKPITDAERRALYMSPGSQ